MDKSVIEKVQAQFRGLVREQVAKGNHSRWGESESVAVVEGLFALAASDDEIGGEGFDAIREQVKRVINPSAFAQGLEGLSDGTGRDKEGKADLAPDGSPNAAHPAWIRRAEKGKRSGRLDV